MMDIMKIAIGKSHMFCVLYIVSVTELRSLNAFLPITVEIELLTLSGLSDVVVFFSCRSGIREAVGRNIRVRLYRRIQGQETGRMGWPAHGLWVPQEGGRPPPRQTAQRFPAILVHRLSQEIQGPSYKNQQLVILLPIWRINLENQTSIH